MGRNTTQELLTWHPVFCLVLISFTFKLTQTYIYKRTKLTQSSCTFAYNLKVKKPKHGTIVNSPHRGYTSVEVPLFPCHVPTSVSRKHLTVPYTVQTHLHYLYVPLFGYVLFCITLNETTYMFQHLVTTTNVPKVRYKSLDTFSGT